METADLVLLSLASAGSLAALVLALVVFTTGRDRSMNRRLAWVLVADAFFQSVFAAELLIGIPASIDPFLVHVALLGVAVTYVAFIATLDTPISRWLRRRAIIVTVLVALVGVVAANIAVLAPAIARGETSESADPGWSWPLVALTSLFALVVAISAYRRAEKGTLLRRRAGFFVLAFGARDALFVLGIFGWALLTLALERPDLADLLSPPMISLATILFSGFLAYGILQSQLFDIDLKIKRGISRSTVAAIGIALVLVAAKITEFYVSSTLGLVAGGAMAGLALFLAPRLNKLGDKVADKAMPRVQATSSYLEFKKMEVYRAAVESALENDGSIDGPERAMLDRLRGKLGIPPDDAGAMERELAEAHAGQSASAA